MRLVTGGPQGVLGAPWPELTLLTRPVLVYLWRVVIMVWRRMRVTRKTGGKGSVSYTITIPEEVYQAMGRPGEVLVTYSSGVMLVKPARTIHLANAGIEDPRASQLLRALNSRGASQGYTLLDTIRSRLEEDAPRLLALDCPGGGLAYIAGEEVEVLRFDPALCSEVMGILSEVLAVGWEGLEKEVGRGRVIVEVAQTKVVIYRA